MHSIKPQKNRSNAHIQICQCGGVHLCMDNLTIHMKKDEFVALADQFQKAKTMLSQNSVSTAYEGNHEIH